MHHHDGHHDTIMIMLILMATVVDHHMIHYPDGAMITLGPRGKPPCVPDSDSIVKCPIGVTPCLQTSEGRGEGGKEKFHLLILVQDPAGINWTEVSPLLGEGHRKIMADC